MYVCTYVCMYVCMYVPMYVRTYVCIYVCMYVYMYVCMYVCMYACMYACMYVCMHACMYVCMYVSICLFIYLSICLFIYVSMYLCMCVCVYVCTYVRMYVCIYVCMYVRVYIYIKPNVASGRPPRHRKCLNTDQPTRKLGSTRPQTNSQHFLESAWNSHSLSRPTNSAMSCPKWGGGGHFWVSNAFESGFVGHRILGFGTMICSAFIPNKPLHIAWPAAIIPTTFSHAPPLSYRQAAAPVCNPHPASSFAS